MKMYEVILRRLLLIIPVLFGASLITFSLSHVFQNPIYAFIPPGRYEKTPPEYIERTIKKHHLDKPWYEQYLYYLRDLVSGDWGYSEMAKQDVFEAIAVRFPATMELAILSVLIAIVIGIPLGIVSATKQNSMTDHVSRIFALSGGSFPVFWLAMVLQYQFGYKWNLLPVSLRVDTFVNMNYPLNQITGFFLVDSLITLNLPFFFSAIKSIIMPTICLAWLQMSLISRMTRASMLEAINQDYITLARSKGLSERIVVYKHALRNAMIPTITILGLSFAGLLTGAVLIENVFSWPGVGQLAVRAVMAADSPAVQGFVLLTGIIFIFINLTVDILYTIVDPRIQFQ